MARKIVVSALIFFAIVGMASAAAEAPAPETSEDAGIGPVPDSNVIGTVGGYDDHGAPVGSPVSPGTFPDSPAQSQNSGAITLEAASTLAALLVSASLFF